MATQLPIIYQEPTYELRLSPLQAPGLHNAAQKPTPYQDLDALVDQVMKERYGNNVKNLSPNKLKQHRKEIAFSLMNRPDQKSALEIKLPLAKDLGLVEAINNRLKTTAGTDKDLTPLAELVFSSCEEKNFPLILSVTINMLPKSLDRNTLFTEVCNIRNELRNKTAATMKYFRPTQEADGASYIDHKGQTVVLSQTIPSSFDRENPHVQNSRCNLNHQGHVIYSTGRIETEQKAYEALFPLIQQTFMSGQIKPENLAQQDGSYLYPVVIENLISSPPIAAKERGYLLKEDEVLKSLNGQTFNITLPSGDKITVKPQLMHFSTQTNYNAFFGQHHGWSSTGADVGERITDEGNTALEAYYDQVKDKLTQEQQTALNQCFNDLKTSTQIQDRFILRSFICELLNIPYHIHCKSSKDRTAVVAAIKKGLHQWLEFLKWSGETKLPKPQDLLKLPAFRELTEAALFENLPITDQGVGMSGVLDGKLYTQDRGFSFQKSLFEHALPAAVLSDRYLHQASIVERVLYTTALSLAALLILPLYLVFTPITMGVLYYKFKDDFLDAYTYILLALLILPIASGSRESWIDRDSKDLKERKLLCQRTPPKDAPFLQTLSSQVDNLSTDQYTTLVQLLKAGNPTAQLPPILVQILQDMGNNWNSLKRTEKKGRLEKLFSLAENSPLVLFKIHTQFTAENLQQFFRDGGYTLATEEAEAQSINGINQFKQDAHRAHYVVNLTGQSIKLEPNGENVTELPKAMEQLPPFKNSTEIPYAVKDFLTQKTTFNIFANKYLWTLSNQLMLGEIQKRVLTIQSQNESSIDIYLEEDFRIMDAGNPEKDPLGLMHFKGKFTLTLDPTKGWTAAFTEMDPVRAKWTGDVTPLLSVHTVNSHESTVREQKYNNTIQILKNYIQAYAIANEQQSHSLKAKIDSLFKNLQDQGHQKPQFNSDINNIQTAHDNCSDPTKKAVILPIITYLQPPQTDTVTVTTDPEDEFVDIPL